jgi:PAS domain-containing protein
MYLNAEMLLELRDNQGRSLLSCCVLMSVATASSSHGLLIALISVACAGVVLSIVTNVMGRRAGRRSLEQRLSSLGSRLGIESRNIESGRGIERALTHIEQGIAGATEAMEESSSDAIRLRRALDTLPQGVMVCDENGEDIFRNARADALMGGRHGDALAAQAVTELLAEAWEKGSSSRVLGGHSG